MHPDLFGAADISIKTQDDQPNLNSQKKARISTNTPRTFCTRFDCNKNGKKLRSPVELVERTTILQSATYENCTASTAHLAMFSHNGTTAPYSQGPVVIRGTEKVPYMLLGLQWCDLGLVPGTLD